MRKIGISAKIIGLLAASMIVMAAIIFMIAAYDMNGVMEKGVNQELLAAARTARSELDNEQTSLMESAGNNAIRAQFIKAAAESNKDLASELCSSVVKAGVADYCFITTSDGDILSTEKLLAHQDQNPNLPTVEIKKGSDGQPLIEARHPIKNGPDSLGGFLILGKTCLSDNTLVDKISKLTGVEVSVFIGKIRISTTVKRGAKRALGEAINNEEIERTVLAKGNEATELATAGGITRNVAMIPLVSHEGKIIGMIGTGKDREEIVRNQQALIMRTLFGGIITFALVFVGAFFFSKTISAPITLLAAFVEQIAKGNFDASLDAIKPRKDELGVLTNGLTAMKESLLKERQAAAESMALAEEESRNSAAAKEQALAAAEEAKQAKAEGMKAAAEAIQLICDKLLELVNSLKVSSLSISNGAGQQESGTSEIASAMNQMNITVAEVAKNASSAALGAADSQKGTTAGVKNVEKIRFSIKTLSEQARILGTESEQLTEAAERIGTVLTVIEDVADQTNLLALNAAIEAARAGDAGRGFAVVADEVRKLAERAIKATAEVALLIENIRKAVVGNNRGIALISQETRIVAEATDAADETLAKTLSVTSDAAEKISAIATAAEEQSAASEQITRSMEEISRISHENRSASDQAMAYTNEVAHIVETLQSLVAKLQTGQI